MKERNFSRKYLNYFIVFFCFTICYSCDIFSVAEIVNASQKNILVEIKYDKELFVEKYKDKTITYLNKFANESGSLKSLDSVNFISIIEMSPKDSLIIEFERGYEPHFKLIKEITIYKNDTTVLEKNNFQDLFEEKLDQRFIYDVK
ncbi:hypothetical protein [Flavobacterium sp.]|uniref:hypothetical protein n=1 Tax=Flavobacterium sp. TaxID=239 RepID=UPI0026321377|nr:hypothetical protein [Flavobacterium sp.]